MHVAIQRPLSKFLPNKRVFILGNHIKWWVKQLTVEMALQLLIASTTILCDCQE